MAYFHRILLALLLAVFPFACIAQQGDMTPEQAKTYLEEQFAKLHPQHGKIALGNNLATLTVPEDYGYLSPQETEVLVHNIWDNPPGMKTLGAIVPIRGGKMSLRSWAVIITYNDDGHVNDDDAATLNYAKMLSQMQEANAQDSRRRKEEGYPAFTLTGWAEQPHYDKESHKLYWALKLKDESSDRTDINYNIRVLGRQGYLVMSLVGALEQLPEIEQNAGKILSLVEFNTTQRYADFNPATDKVAAYGMAALIAGYAAAKVGLFKGLLLKLLALKKFILMAFVAVAAFFRNLFNKKKKD